MAESRHASGATGELEPRDVSRYVAKTNRVCTSCGKSPLYIKLQHEASSDLECPNCDLLVHVAKGTENT